MKQAHSNSANSLPIHNTKAAPLERRGALLWEEKGAFQQANNNSLLIIDHTHQWYINQAQTITIYPHLFASIYLQLFAHFGACGCSCPFSSTALKPLEWKTDINCRRRGHISKMESASLSKSMGVVDTLVVMQRACGFDSHTLMYVYEYFLFMWQNISLAKSELQEQRELLVGANQNLN